jgi:hypothetical protein
VFVSAPALQAALRARLCLPLRAAGASFRPAVPHVPLHRIPRDESLVPFGSRHPIAVPIGD